MSELTLHARHLACSQGGTRHLIVLHGLLGSSDNWQTLGKRYASHHHVWMLDARNHGRSPHAPSHTYTEMPEDVVRFMDEDALKSAASVLLSSSI